MRVKGPVLTDHRGAAGHRRLRADFKVVDRHSAHERQLEVRVRVNAALDIRTYERGKQDTPRMSTRTSTTRHHEPPGGVDLLNTRASSNADANFPAVNAIFKKHT